MSARHLFVPGTDGRCASIIEDRFCALPKDADVHFASSDSEERVDHPKHYNSHPSGIECITIVEHMSFNVGNAIKYLWRADEKGAPIEDLKKAAWYINREIERRENNYVPLYP